jgi:hypothetical protein
MDDQWNMWTKVGVRKLVSLDGETTTMSEHESCIVMSQHRSQAVGNSRQRTEEALLPLPVNFPLLHMHCHTRRQWGPGTVNATKC